MTRLLHYGWKVVDIDLGEMFLNFNIHHLLIPYSGVDLTQFREEILKEFPQYSDILEDRRIGSVFNKTFFGYRASPINAAKSYYLSEEILRGNPNDPENVLKWDTIILNMLGDASYNPALPNVYKWCSGRQQMAPDMTAFVDDLRALGLSYEQAWKVARQIASRLQYLGIQDAPRKRRLDNGPWAGGVYGTSNNQITKTVTQEKWEKGKRYLAEIRQEIKESKDDSVSFKKLESVRGFFCHLAMVYDIFFPYLKGFHLMLAAHLPKRTEGGWKMKDSQWIGYIQSKVEDGLLTQLEADNLLNPEQQVPIENPERVKVNEIYLDSMKALETFMREPTPPNVVVRQAQGVLLVYGFLDASGSGFGSSTLIANKIHYRVGTWKGDDLNNSSNWKEFANLVNDVKEAGKKGWLTGNVIVLATDNETVEKVFYKGNSSDKKLFELVLELRQLELKYGARLIISHVSGKRMIAQGTDGLSRGSMNKGVSLGINMLTFCPWNKTALEVQPKLKPWLETWIGKDTIFLEPKDWFVRGHDITSYEKKGPFWTPVTQQGVYVWSPAPAAADVTLEQLRIARIKRQNSSHLIIIPKLLTSQWLKQLYKAADLIVFCPPIHSFWNKNNFEHLTFAFVFPFLKFRPFQQCKTPKMFRMGRDLLAMFKTEGMAEWNLLHQFWTEHQRLPSLSRSLVWKVLYYSNPVPFPRSFRKGKTGDLEENNKSKRRGEQDWRRRTSLKETSILKILSIMPEKLKARIPIRGSEQDLLLLACMRRANLDAFWSRASGSVDNNRRLVSQAKKFMKTLGLPNPYDIPSPAPTYDYAGYQIAYTMLMHSRGAGRHSIEYVQFTTIRKHRAAYSNFVRAYPSGNYRNLGLGDITGKYLALSDDPCSSLWFRKFIYGCSSRMGRIWKPDKAMSLELLMAVLEKAENFRLSEDLLDIKHKWSVFTSYVTVSYVLSLRGNEGFLLRLEETISNWTRNDGRFFYIALFGKIKGEDVKRLHLIPCINETGSGIKVKFIVSRLIEEKRYFKQLSGWMISDNKNNQYSSSTINDMLHTILLDLFESRKQLFPPFIQSVEDIYDSYHCFRTFRKTSDTRAIDQNVSESDIDVVNRWSTRGSLKAAQAAGKMRIYYAQPELLIEPFLRYASKL